MKVGDLVTRRNELVRETVGRGIVIDTQEQHGLPYSLYQVQWLRLHEPGWYDGPELEVISESR